MKIYGLYKDEEWLKPYGYGPKKTMNSVLKSVGEEGVEIREIDVLSTSETRKKTIFADTIERFGITCYKISKETGVNQSTINNWKNGNFRPNPYDDNYMKVIDYVERKTGVSLSLLDFVRKK